jgi:hypothetical protein
MGQKRRSKVVEMRRGESVQITVPQVAIDTQKITVTLEHKSGQHARLRIQAGDEVLIDEPATADAVQPG